MRSGSFRRGATIQSFLLQSSQLYEVVCLQHANQLLTVSMCWPSIKKLSPLSSAELAGGRGHAVTCVNLDNPMQAHSPCPTRNLKLQTSHPKPHT